MSWETEEGINSVFLSFNSSVSKSLAKVTEGEKDGIVERVEVMTWSGLWYPSAAFLGILGKKKMNMNICSSSSSPPPVLRSSPPTPPTLTPLSSPPLLFSYVSFIPENI